MGDINMTTKLYITGTTIWLIALAQIADFHPFENMKDLAGQVIGF
jgi:hypothetical protein